MKTKFVLHGGFAKGIKQQNNAFFQEILKDTPEEAKILLVYFAEEEEKIPLRIKQDTEEFETNRGSKKIKLRVASEKTFKTDCAWADAIYLHGGKTQRIKERLSLYSDIRDIFSGKTIAGDSAGVNVLSKLCFTKNTNTLVQGLGVLPLKTMCHYTENETRSFGDIEPKAETLLLRDYEIKVIYQDLP